MYAAHTCINCYRLGFHLLISNSGCIFLLTWMKWAEFFGRIFTHPIRERLLFWWVTVFFELNSDFLPQVPALVKKALNHLITYFHVMWQNECIINCFSNLHCMWHILSFFTNVDDPWSSLSQMLVIYTLTWACRCI